MRIVAIVVAIAALSAAAQGPEEFRGRAAITLPAPAALYRVAIPEAVYRDGRADLGDLRIFNARGEPVPIAMAMEPEATREALPPVELASFPLTSLEPSRPPASQVTVRLADGTMLAVDARGKAAAAERRVAGYILDASALEDPLQSLDIDWAVPDREAIKVRVEASDDLRTWRPVAGPVTLLRIEQGGRRLEQSRVPLDGLRAKYLRLVVVDTPFTLRSARAELRERTRPSELAVKRVSGQAGARPGEAAYDLGARLPVESVRLVPAESNSVIAAGVFVRDAPDATPSWVAQATFYKLTRDGAEVQSPFASIRRRAARYWIVRTDPEKGGYGAALPQLEVQWRPAEVVFVARGAEPFTLAFGNPQARSALLPVASLIPGYEAHAELKLPEAKLAAVTRASTARDAWPAWLQDVSPRKLALWAILVGAVLLLAFMAWRLHKAAR
jgi:hypothetical protein